MSNNQEILKTGRFAILLHSFVFFVRFVVNGCFVFFSPFRPAYGTCHGVCVLTMLPITT